jgi:hypothetical protein
MALSRRAGDVGARAAALRMRLCRDHGGVLRDPRVHFAGNSIHAALADIAPSRHGGIRAMVRMHYGWLTCGRRGR